MFLQYYKEVSSYPVGYERPLDLYPLDFEEFLWALGMNKDVILETKKSFFSGVLLPSGIEKRFSELFQIFMLVGGMPTTVNTYLETGSLTSTRESKIALLENYKNDIMKYANTADKQKILKTFESIPFQLAKKNKKFMWADIDLNDTNTSERKYGSALSWLKDAGVINFCHNLSEPTAPLAMHKKIDSYKVYMRDTGLLISMLEPGLAKEVLSGNDMVNEGGITENIVASEFVAHGYPLTYFEKRGSLEIDFVLNLDGAITAIEVKSGKHTQAKSLDSTIKNYQSVTRYIQFEKDAIPYHDNDGIEHYPLFMVMWV